jgi:hypothetical protein
MEIGSHSEAEYLTFMNRKYDFTHDYFDKLK